MPINNSSHDQLETSLAEIDWDALTQGRTYYPSPARWDDQLLYFLLVDRFSDGSEVGGYADLAGQSVVGVPGRATPLFRFPEDAYTADRAGWFEAGKRFCGGTIAGLRSKLGYLSRLGVDAIWVSPVFRNPQWQDGAYHGYGIQNFLDVDPRFGTREELRQLVEEAHAQGLRVILDIIFNHSGDVFDYAADRYWNAPDGKPLAAPDPRWDGRDYAVKGWRDGTGDPRLPFARLDPGDPGHWPDAGVWPSELQSPEAFSRRGVIHNWDHDPEHRQGDFLSLKDLHHGTSALDPDLQRRAESFQAAPSLFALARAFCFWIAYADVDGFRIDTVKHMEPGAVRIFANVVHEFAQSLGKERFYLIGEITGGRRNAVEVMRATGIDAALGIDDIPDRLEFLAKGFRSPKEYFQLFRNSLLEGLGGHQWYGEHIVNGFDDHDQVGADRKFRFAGDKANQGWRFLPLAIGINLTTLGIPCLYYGTEQGFDGYDSRTDPKDTGYSDVLLRECMFGGPFGSLQSSGRHFFREDHPLYRLIRELADLRRSHMPLRRGRQYLRSLSRDGQSFFVPEKVGDAFRFAFAWSRIFADNELLVVANTDPDQTFNLWFTLDHGLTPPGTHLRCLFSTDLTQRGASALVEARNGAAVRLTVPPAGLAVWGR